MDDLALPQHHRSGAHRARRHPLLVLLITLGSVGLASALLLWALLSLDVLGVGDDLRRAGGVSSTVPADPSTVPADPSAAATGESSAPAPAASPGATTDEAPSAVPGEEPAGVVDRSLPLDVLNSTGTTGLAMAAAAELEELGWTTGEVGNYPDERPTTVLYPDDAQQATAAAVADELGVGVVSASEDVAVITVVLGPDYPA